MASEALAFRLESLLLIRLGISTTHLEEGRFY